MNEDPDLRLDRPTSTIDPSHYRNGTSVECIEVIRHWPGSLFNAGKYMWRAGSKDAEIVECQKALWYMRDYKAFPPPYETALAPVPHHLTCIENDFPPRRREILRHLYKVAHGSKEDINDAIECAIEIIKALKETPA